MELPGIFATSQHEGELKGRIKLINAAFDGVKFFFEISYVYNGYISCSYTLLLLLLFAFRHCQQPVKPS